MNATSELMLEHKLARVEDLLARPDLLRELGHDSPEAKAFLWNVRRHSPKALDNHLRLLNGESFEQVFPEDKSPIDLHPVESAARIKTARNPSPSHPGRQTRQ